MALGRQIVNLVRLGFLDDADQVGRIGQIPVVHHKPDVFFVQVPVEMIHTTGVEGGRPALDAVHQVILPQQQFSQVGAVLTGDAGNECGCHWVLLSWF
jgi:hypothetical protein